MTRKDLSSMFVYKGLLSGSHDITHNLDIFIANLVMFIDERLWESGWWDEPTSKWKHAPSLSEFITSRCPDGIGKSVEWVYASLKGPSEIDPAALKALQKFDKAISDETGKHPRAMFEQKKGEAVPVLADHGVNQHGGDNNVISSQGNTSRYTLARLKRDHAALAECVIAGELSANAAAIQAGFRKPTWTAPTEPESLAAAIKRKFGDEFALALKQAL